MAITTNSSERMRIDSSGKVGIGQASTDATLHVLGNGARLVNSADTDALHLFAFDGNGAALYTLYDQIGTAAGKIGCAANKLMLGGGDTGLVFQGYANDAIAPFSPDNANIRDDAIDLGYSSSRFDDIYATNGTIQTSDQNEKQDIAGLTSAEITAAKAISKLFKTFKWNKSVTNNGDAARIHTGVIAQEVQAAMSDAGLDASKYAFWCSNTWWEADETYTNDAGEEKTRTRQYHVEEEAPEGATKRTRLGVRYPELLAFVGAATEQRLADIETRLTALENA
jgi:hypothetical protein